MERWGVTYLAGGWLILQILDVLGEGFGWSAAAIRATTAIVIAGLPIVLWLGWWRSQEERRALRARELVLLVGMAVTAVTVGLTAPRFLSGADAAQAPITAQALITAATVDPADPRAIAVLPFDDATGSTESYFAEGIHEEILVALSKIGGFRITSRASVARFKDGDRDPRDIARSLGVGSLITGSVRVAREQVRVTIELSNPATGESLWSDIFESELNDVFAIQSEVASQVADALEIAMTESERDRLAARPTESTEAQDKMWRARALLRRPGYEPRDLSEAEELLESAVDSDPAFADAYAQLASLHHLVYRFAIDASAERRARGDRALRRALALDPELPEANLALGFKLYQVDGDYEGALRAFDRAREATPSDSRALAGLGFAYRRHGEWGQALVQLRAATVVDPLNSDHWLALGTTLRVLRRFEEAEFAYQRMEALEPESVTPALQIGHLRADWLGDLETLRLVLERVEREDATNRRSVWAAYVLALLRGEYSKAVSTLDESGIESFDGSNFVRPTSLLKAWALEADGDMAGARAAYTEAREELEDKLRVLDDDARLHAGLGLVLAGLGLRDEAIASAERAMALEPESENAMYGPAFSTDYAMVLARVGEIERALAEVRRLLEVPGQLTPAQLRLDPRWSPLRGTADFDELAMGPVSDAASAVWVTGLRPG